MKFNYVLIILILTLNFLMGCSNDEYHQPQININSKWDVQNDFTKKSKIKLAYLEWWLDFHDPVLKNLIEEGLKSNQQILASKQRIEAAIGEVKKVRNQWIPNVDFWTGYANNPIYGFPGTLFVFVPSYFINFYQQYHQFKISKIQLKETCADDDVIKLMIISEIASSYFGYLAYQDYLNNLQLLKNDLAQMQKISYQMNQVGLIADIQPHHIQHQLMQVEGEIFLTKKNIIRFRNALRYLINKNPGSIKTHQKFSNLMNKPKVIAQVPMQVLLNRPDLKVAEYRLRAAFYNVKLAKSPFIPRFEFDMFPGWVARNNAYHLPQSYLKFNDQLLKTHVFKWSVLGEIDKAKSQKQAIFYEYLDTLRKVLRDASIAYENHDKSTKNLIATKQATSELWVIYSRHHQLEKQGIQSKFEVFSSKIKYDRMKLILNQAQLQQLLSIVRLYQELGGGYKVEKNNK